MSAHHPSPPATGKTTAVLQLAAEVRAGRRAALGRAITLVESRRAEDRAAAEALLVELLPATGGAIRLGITGLPGAGKSTLIEQLGLNLIAAGHTVAVLAVDPSSTRTRGSILGDKLRMARLAQAEGAFIRPSPSGGALGGVGGATREAILLAEAAGHDVVIVETVGVGQSEAAVAGMVDVFLVVIIAGAGDEVQGMKRGLLEHADIIAVNKADVDAARAEATAADYRAALTLFTRVVPVMTVSALADLRLDALWQALEARHAADKASGALERRRTAQAGAWLREAIQAELAARVSGDFGGRLAKAEAAVAAGVLPLSAARAALD